MKLSHFSWVIYETRNIADREISSNSSHILMKISNFSWFVIASASKLFSSLSRAFHFLSHNQSAISINFSANVVNTTRLYIRGVKSSKGGHEGWKFLPSCSIQSSNRYDNANEFLVGELETFFSSDRSPAGRRSNYQSGKFKGL